MAGTYMTIVGNVATKADRRTFPSGATRVGFRVASTQRRRGPDGWSDGDTLFVTVNCWRQLGDNVLVSLRVGDPVIVHGRLYTRSYEHDGRRTSVTEMDADAVGPDLRWSTAEVTRTRGAAALTPDPVEEPGGADGGGTWGSADGSVADGRAREPEVPDPRHDSDGIVRLHEPYGGRAEGSPPDGRGAPAEAAVGS